MSEYGPLQRALTAGIILFGPVALSGCDTVSSSSSYASAAQIPRCDATPLATPEAPVAPTYSPVSPPPVNATIDQIEQYLKHSKAVDDKFAQAQNAYSRLLIRLSCMRT